MDNLRTQPGPGSPASVQRQRNVAVTKAPKDSNTVFQEAQQFIDKERQKERLQELRDRDEEEHSEQEHQLQMTTKSPRQITDKPRVGAPPNRDEIEKQRQQKKVKESEAFLLRIESEAAEIQAELNHQRQKQAEKWKSAQRKTKPVSNSQQERAVIPRKGRALSEHKFTLVPGLLCDESRPVRKPYPPPSRPTNEAQERTWRDVSAAPTTQAERTDKEEETKVQQAEDLKFLRPRKTTIGGHEEQELADTIQQEKAENGETERQKRLDEIGAEERELADKLHREQGEEFTQRVEAESANIKEALEEIERADEVKRQQRILAEVLQTQAGLTQMAHPQAPHGGLERPLLLTQDADKEHRLRDAEKTRGDIEAKAHEVKAGLEQLTTPRPETQPQAQPQAQPPAQLPPQQPQMDGAEKEEIMMEGPEPEPVTKLVQPVREAAVPSVPEAVKAPLREAAGVVQDVTQQVTGEIRETAKENQEKTVNIAHKAMYAAGTTAYTGLFMATALAVTGSALFIYLPLKTTGFVCSKLAERVLKSEAPMSTRHTTAKTEHTRSHFPPLQQQQQQQQPTRVTTDGSDVQQRVDSEAARIQAGLDQMNRPRAIASDVSPATAADGNEKHDGTEHQQTESEELQQRITSEAQQIRGGLEQMDRPPVTPNVTPTATPIPAVVASNRRSQEIDRKLTESEQFLQRIEEEAAHIQAGLNQLHPRHTQPQAEGSVRTRSTVGFAALETEGAEKVRGDFEKGRDIANAAAGSAVDTTKDATDRVVDTAKDAVEQVKDRVVEPVKETAQKIAGGASGAAENVVDIAKEAAGTAFDTAKGATEQVKGRVVEPAKEAAENVACGAADTAKDTAKWDIDTVAGTAGEMKGRVVEPAVDTAQHMGKSAKSTIGELKDRVVGTAKGTAEHAAEPVRETVDQVKGQAKRTASLAQTAAYAAGTATYAGLFAATAVITAAGAMFFYLPMKAAVAVFVDLPMSVATNTLSTLPHVHTVA